MTYNIAKSQHPEYSQNIGDWYKYRLAYETGRDFVEQYLVQFSRREDSTDFEERKKITYCPSFSKAGINEIKNSIYERMLDIVRVGGTKTYQQAVRGDLGGVDLAGSSMNYFLGCYVLSELLVLGRVGVYVDMPPINGPSIAHNSTVRPYLYIYKAEDIKAWTFGNPRNPREVTSLLLCDYVFGYDEGGFPSGIVQRFRKLWINENGLVSVAFYDDQGEQTDFDGNKSEQTYTINLDRIPFYMFEISQSLMVDAADYQIALLNLASSDLAYALKSNFPFYVEEYDTRSESPYLRPTNSENTGEKTDAGLSKDRDIKVGVTTGRRYPKGTNPPSFIHPSPEPMLASIQKQEQLKAEIRLIINLNIANLQPPKMASAESKQEDSKSLESGLSYIGLELEQGERQIASIWSSYEGKKEVATVTYPEDYSLKSVGERIAEADNLSEIQEKIPSPTFQKIIAKRVAKIVVGNRTPREDMDKIDSEIDAAKSLTCVSEIIAKDVEIGLVDLETASEIRGYPKGSVEKAKKDHAERLARIAESQAANDPADAGARGVKDASGDPAGARKEKKESRETVKDDKVTDKTRGEGK